MIKIFRDKLILIGGAVLLLSTISHAGQNSAFMGAVKNADGSLKYMNQSDAIQYCLRQGAHLPSSRELAQLSKGLGAKGIVDNCGSDKKCHLVEGYRIGAINSDGIPERFNFSFAGYFQPAGQLDSHWFWSSSVTSMSAHYAYVLDGANGNVYIDYRSDQIAVRCVSGRPR